MQISASDLMTPVHAVVHDTTTVAAAQSVLLRRGAAEVYVTDAAGRLRGVVPDYEFFKAELTGLDAQTPIVALMSAKLETAEATADIASVLPKFREAWCGRVAVLDQGRLVGRIGRLDALRLVAQLRRIATLSEATVPELPTYTIPGGTTDTIPTTIADGEPRRLPKRRRHPPAPLGRRPRRVRHLTHVER